MKKIVLGLFLGIILAGLMSMMVIAEENDTNQTDNNITLSCSNNLSLCSNETSCEVAGGEWEDSVCNEEKQNDNDKNETEVQACSAINTTSQCEARKNCEYNNATGKCVKITKIKKLKETLQAYLNSTECPENCICAGSTIKCETENGRVMTIAAGKSGNIIIQTKTINASTTVILIKNASGLFGEFKGKHRKINYLPDEVKEKVLKKLKMNNCSNCNITLKDDGSYEMDVGQTYRIIGIFPRKIVSVAKIDSGTGEILMIKKP